MVHIFKEQSTNTIVGEDSHFTVYYLKKNGECEEDSE